jgi:glucose-6-phosphate isomerase
MVFVTNPKEGLLRELAQSEGIRAFDIPPNVASRYSALTPAGLLPAAVLGIDVAALLDGAAAMVERVTADEVLGNPACQLAAGAYLASRDLGRTSLVMMPYCDALRAASAWFVHLWAESLGKRHNRLGEEVRAGQTPITAIGATDQYTQAQLMVEGPADKAVLLVKVETHHKSLPIPDELSGREEVRFLQGHELADVLEAGRRATRAMLLDGGVPVIEVTLPSLDAAHLGGFLVLLQASCACTGMLMGINPLDQPGVGVGQRMTLGLLGRPGYDSEVDRVGARDALEKEGAKVS